jgi:hypothetical protein
MNNILLQTQLPPSTIDWLIGQAPTVTILGIVAYFIWKRLTEVETKLMTYLEDDRIKMMDVIEKNTRAFERLYDSIGSKFK